MGSSGSSSSSSSTWCEAHTKTGGDPRVILLFSLGLRAWREFAADFAPARAGGGGEVGRWACAVIYVHMPVRYACECAAYSEIIVCYNREIFEIAVSGRQMKMTKPKFIFPFSFIFLFLFVISLAGPWSNIRHVHVPLWFAFAFRALRSSAIQQRNSNRHNPTSLPSSCSCFFFVKPKSKKHKQHAKSQVRP
jgi:hypothetical protein